MTSTVSEHVIPANWDAMFLTTLITGISGMSVRVNEDGTRTIQVTDADFSKVLDAIEAYPTAYLPKAQEIAVARIVEIRREIVKTLHFGGMTLPMDYTTEARITGAVVYLQLDPTVTEINWDRGEGDFVTLTREQMLGLGLAAGRLVQGVFNKAKDLTDRVRAATSSDDPVFTDIEGDWGV
jgi:hypothetical protein